MTKERKRKRKGKNIDDSIVVDGGLYNSYVAVKKIHRREELRFYVQFEEIRRQSEARERKKEKERERRRITREKKRGRYKKG